VGLALDQRLLLSDQTNLDPAGMVWEKRPPVTTGAPFLRSTTLGGLRFAKGARDGSRQVGTPPWGPVQLIVRKNVGDTRLTITGRASAPLPKFVIHRRTL
jgi:hypothetical protein